MSPKSTSSNSVQIVQPPPPTVIDLTVESVEDKAGDLNYPDI